ncbi:hypothetical protein E2C01_087064 [Portunus trituberculatus]|uniref:Uncharacterized protein n=1 Tax=Portunus trituberculatus TaxID=210409 RepID=A0A5B7JD28_PORTR|nr:hypothetical protein [Portunus trituberculatus]
MACVGFKSNTKALVNDNLMYFCDLCKEFTRNMWRSYQCQKEEKSVQTEDSSKKTKKSVQTEKNPKEVKSSHTEEDVVGPQPSRQEEGPRQQHTMKMRKKKAPIRIIGDSMVKTIPREGPFYERLRRSTNRRLQKELLKMKIEWMKEKKSKLSFIDMDSVVDRFSLYEKDGVHLNDVGTARMGRRLCEWVRARSLQPMDQ